MVLAFAGLFLAGSPSTAGEVPASAKQPTAEGHLLVYPNKTWASFPSLQAAIQAGDAAGISAVTFYDWVNYNSSGPTLTYSVSRDCTATTGDKDHVFENFPNGWNDSVSSVSTQLGNGSHCDVWFSADVKFEGECGNQWFDLHPNLTQVPYGCDNKASSFELS
ncbi:hypothetical protein ACF07S_27970 [Streptomyces sp. NPDC016640]|uniref:hypothetical protein n=1 Tax=Streptomyces sp. NPDC016640 TaxID=3364969 RepID=UPI0036FE187B